MKKQTYKTIGLMSGTSCDGLDIAYCEFKFDKKWSYTILKTKAISYSEEMEHKLRNSIRLDEEKLTQFDIDLGEFFGSETLQFIEEEAICEIDFIASHGHTIFHQPEKGITLQIGNGERIKNVTKIPVINDFRSLDIAHGGQGAPLVPVGDKLLFSEYDYCLNIGGIANVSFQENGVRKAYDCCFANMILNPLANKLGLPFDNKGEVARKSNINSDLCQELLELEFNKVSLSYELYSSVILPILAKYDLSVASKIATVTQYTALSIAKIFKPNSTVLITGGGAYNDYLIEIISKNTSATIKQASSELIEFKEALIFAFLGVLKMENIPNCLSSVTGASKDVVGGVWI